MEKNSQKPNKFGSKKRSLSVLPIVFSGVLAAGAIAGSAVSVWQVSKNYTESSEFSKSVKGRIKIDPNGTNDKAQAEDTLKDCAERLSRWLKDQGQKSYDVSYDVEQEAVGEKEQYFGYLTAQFEVDKVLTKKPTSKEEEEQKIDNDPYLSFFENKGFNTNAKTLVYRWYMETPGENDKPVYSFIPFSELFSIPTKDVTDDPKAKPVTNEDGDNGVVFNVNNKLLNDIYLDLAKAKKDSEKEEANKTITTSYQPRIYIVNNINGLYNEANYHLSFWFAKNSLPEYDKWYSGSDYSTFANNYKTKTFKGENRTDQEQQTHYKLDPVKDKDGKDVANADIFNYIDQATAGTNEISFTTKYVDKIITMADFTESMPEKIIDNYDNDVDVEGNNVDIRNFWYKAATKNDARSYLRKQIIYGFNNATIVSVNTDNTQNADEVLIRTRQTIQSTDIAPSFSETIFGGNNVVGILSLGFLIFLIALLIILAVLYRTTGVIAWICMFFALSITLLIASAASTAISMALILGMFTLAIAGFIACINICGRMKRRLLSNEDTQLMIKKTFRKSLLPIIDISVITLIFGVCFTYISPISLNALGVTLIIGAFAIFISIYLLNGLLHGLFFNNKIMVNRFGFFGKPSNVANIALSQGNNDIPTSLDATRLEFAYYCNMSKKRIDTTNKRALIAVCVVGAILIAAIILFSVLGVANSSMFHTTGCLAIQTDQDVIGLGWVNGLNYVSYKHDITSGWWYFYTNMSSNDLANIAKNIPIGITVLVQSIVGSTNLDILNLSLISVVVATLSCSAYAIIRYNWIAFVPMFAGAFGMPLIFLGLSAMFQIKFDEYVILGFALIVVINTIVNANIVGSINEAWSRRDAYNKEEFKYIVNTALKNDWTFLWTTGLSYLLFFIIFAITSPAGSNQGSMLGLLAMGGILIIAVIPFVTSFLLYQFMKIRNVLLSKIVERNKNKVVINYDDIDEQGIEGINKFTRHIPVAKENKPEVK